jgi:hypothetical protein
MAQLPDLSRLELDGEAVDVGQDLQNAGIRKARRQRPRKLEVSDLSRLALDDDPYAGWTDSEGDEDYVVPEELRGLERADASRTRVAPHRRSPAIAEDVRANQGEAGKLFAAIRKQVLGTWSKVAKWYWCEDWSKNGTLTVSQRVYLQKIAQSHDAAAQGVLRKYVLSPASWLRTAYYSVRGQIHDAAIPEASFRQLFDAFVQLRGGTGFLADFSKTPDGYFTQVGWEAANKVLVARALAAHAQLLAPLVDAIRAFGFVSEDHAHFQVLWRFHPVRHNNSSIWHMDENQFMIYGDESMARAEEWTRTGTRAVVATSCLNVDPRLPADQCGTRILSGVPAFTEKAINGILDDLWAAKDALVSYRCNRDKEKYFGVMLNREVRKATERAIAEYTAFPAMHDYTRTTQDRMEHEARVEALLASAGVETLRMRNGEIGTFNDHQYHASSAIPEGHVRIFFVVRGQAQDRRGTPIQFREDAQIVDRQGRLARLSFEPI